MAKVKILIDQSLQTPKKLLHLLPLPFHEH